MIETYISKMEDWLSIGAMPPVIGIIPAAAKLGMGAIQLVGGATAGIFLSLAGLYNATYKPLRNRAWSHVAHGMGNMIGGSVEGVPFLGLVVVLGRLVKSRPIAKPISDADRIIHSIMKTRTSEPREGGLPVSEEKFDSLRIPGGTRIHLSTSQIHSAQHGDAYQGEPTRYFLVSPNNTKFMGYKILESTAYYQKEEAYYASLKNQTVDSAEDIRIPKLEKDSHKTKDRGAYFADPGWEPVITI